MKKIDQPIGFVVGLPIFVQASSPILLATSRIDEAGFGIPFSLLILPIMLLLAAFRSQHLKRRFALPFYVFFLAFSSWVLILATISSGDARVSLLYAAQWVIPFAYVFYYLSLSDVQVSKFINGLFWGTFFGVGYTFLAGFVELISYGALMDLGRMSQNLILPGHYQLYVYVPTLIAFSSLIALIAVRSKIVAVSKKIVALLIFFSISSLLFTAAREGLLIYALGLGFMMLRTGKRYLVAGVVCMILGLSFFALTGSSIALEAAPEEIRILAKIQALGSQDGSLAGRDEMVAMYIRVIKENPLFGSAMSPPSSEFMDAGVTAPSAHNYYVDVFAWGGALAFSLVLFFLLLVAARAVATMSHSRNRFSVEISFLLLLFLLLSNNINVPLRQPLTGAIGAFLIYVVLAGSRLKVGAQG